MSIINSILDNKEKIQCFLDELNCDKDKWFVFREYCLENPTLRNFSSKMSYFLMNKNSKKHRIRYLFLKFTHDLEFSHWAYKKSTINDFKIEYDKYKKVDNGYLRFDLFEKYELIDLFSDPKIYGVHYLEAFHGTPPHKDPWKYSNDYKNVIFYSNTPKDIQLKVKGKKVSFESPMITNFGNERHGYEFETINSPLRVLHIDCESI